MQLTSHHRLFIVQWQTQNRTTEKGIEENFLVKAIIVDQIVRGEIKGEKIVQEVMKTTQVLFIIKTKYLFNEQLIIIFPEAAEDYRSRSPLREPNIESVNKQNDQNPPSDDCPYKGWKHYFANESEYPII